MRSLTHLAGALSQARRADRAARGLSVPLAGYPGMGRRALIRSAAALAAAGLMPHGLRADQRLTGPLVGEVAIIGGGLAGLVALDRLTAAGIPARLYEARARLGGRMMTRSDFPANGRWVEIGGHLVNTDHADMIALAEELGLGLLDAKADGGADHVLIGGEPIAGEALVEALAPIAAQIARDSERLDADPLGAMSELDQLSVADYLDRHRDLLGAPGVRGLLEQSVRTEFGAEPGAASALTLIYNLPTVDGTAYEVLGASDERYIIEGGSQRITDALAARHATRIEIGRKLAALAPLEPGATRALFADGSSVDASHMILAVPAGILANIPAQGVFAENWQNFHRGMRLGRNGKLNAAYTASPWRATPMGASGATWEAGSAPAFAEAWEAAPAQPGNEGALTWFFGGDLMERMDDGSPREVMGRVHQAVGSAMGDVAGAFTGEALRTEWHRDPLTGGAYSTFAPGQLTQFAGLLWYEDEQGGAAQQARDGQILFAGEHVSDAWSGYMNGAAQTGRLAAQTLIAELTAQPMQERAQVAA